MYLRKKMFSENGQHSENKSNYSGLKALATLGLAGGALYGAHKLNKYIEKKQTEKDRKELEEYRADQKRRGLSRAEIEQEDRDRKELLTKKLVRESYRR